jgi:hypothetical protein
MKVGDLVRTMPSSVPWGKTIGIIEERDPNSLHGPGWWILLPSHGTRVSRHPGDIEVISESR